MPKFRRRRESIWTSHLVLFHHKMKSEITMHKSVVSVHTGQQSEIQLCMVFMVFTHKSVKVDYIFKNSYRCEQSTDELSGIPHLIWDILVVQTSVMGTSSTFTVALKCCSCWWWDSSAVSERLLAQSGPPKSSC